jgi:putative Mg2+ transporter-C (MgtC) family protein
MVTDELLPAAIHLLGVFLLTAVIGWNREQESHNTGIRAFPIVGISSCAYMMVMAGKGVDVASQSRVLQGLVAGIGFIGGGAIVKEGATPHGTATAASVWCAGAVGAAVALDRWAIALLLTAMNLIALRALLPIKQRLAKSDKPCPD